MHFSVRYSFIHDDWGCSANYHRAELEMVSPYPRTLPTNTVGVFVSAPTWLYPRWAMPLLLWRTCSHVTYTSPKK